MAHLAFISANMGGGGAERVVLALLEEFVKRGHTIDLVLMQMEGELLELVPPQVRIIDLGAGRVRGALLPLVRYLRERRPDSVLALLWSLTVIAILAGLIARTGARILVGDHGILSRQYGRSRLAMVILRITTRFIYPRAAARICVSEGCAADLSQVSGLTRDAFSVINNPISAPSELPRLPEIDQLWTGAKRRVLTVGSLKEVKNHSLLLRAFARLGRSPEHRLIILGDGQLRSLLEQQVRELGIEDQVVMPGFAVDPWPYYASADLFVLTSNNEAYPMVLLEALHAGLPVVSTDCPFGPREILDGGRFGELVPVGDEKALTDAMSAALARPSQAEGGRQWVHKLGAESIDRYEQLMVGN